jgi:hypothetical protein
MFGFGKKKVVLHCYTDNQTLYDFLAPEKANKFYPQWWKDLEASYKEHRTPVPVATMKGCRGFIELYRNSIVLPMWSDLMVHVGDLKSKALTHAIMNTPTTAHPVQQRGAWLPAKNYGHAKFDNPWIFHCDEPVQFMMSSPFYNLDKPEDLMIPPGILDFKYQQGANVNMLFDYREQARDVIIKAGDPVMMLTPLTEREVVIVKHKLSGVEFKDMKQMPFTFSNQYGFNKRVIDKAEAEKKCPFGFGKK